MGDKSKIEWTAGPRHCEGPDIFGDRNILHDADRLAVAAVVSNFRPPEEVAANARLVAAVPELRDALRKTASLLSFLKTEVAEPTLRRRIGDVLAMAYATLDKAENRTNRLDGREHNEMPERANG
jgi:hypothetical protein